MPAEIPSSVHIERGLWSSSFLSSQCTHIWCCVASTYSLTLLFPSLTPLSLPWLTRVHCCWTLKAVNPLSYKKCRHYFWTKRWKRVMAGVIHTTSMSSVVSFFISCYIHVTIFCVFWCAHTAELSRPEGATPLCKATPHRAIAPVSGRHFPLPPSILASPLSSGREQQQE